MKGSLRKVGCHPLYQGIEAAFEMSGQQKMTNQQVPLSSCHFQVAMRDSQVPFYSAQPSGAVVVSKLQVRQIQGYDAVKPLQYVRRHKHVGVQHQRQGLRAGCGDLQDRVDVNARFSPDEVDCLGPICHGLAGELGKLSRSNLLIVLPAQAGRCLAAEVASEVAPAEVNHITWQELIFLCKAEVMLEASGGNALPAWAGLLPGSVSPTSVLAEVAPTERLPGLSNSATQNVLRNRPHKASFPLDDDSSIILSRIGRINVIVHRLWGNPGMLPGLLSWPGTAGIMRPCGSRLFAVMSVDGERVFAEDGTCTWAMNLRRSRI